MGEARDVIARSLASVGTFDPEDEATVVDMALHAAGYRITRRSEQAVTDAMVEAALVAWFEEITWSKGMTQKMKRQMQDNMRAALKAAMEAGR